MRPGIDGCVDRPWGRALLVYVDKFGRSVCCVGGRWHWLDVLVWRRLRHTPEVDLDRTRRWFGYSFPLEMP
jgi:hypothetical protein